MRRILILPLLLLMLTACGKKGPVRPVEHALPEAPRNLALEQRGDGFLLFWEAPEANQDGSKLPESLQYRISRMEFDPADDCPECRDLSSPLARIDSRYPQPARFADGRFAFFDAPLKSGTGYRYRIEALGPRGNSGEPARVARAFLPPPAPPGELAGEELDRLIRLRWEPPATRPADAVFIGYRVYRRLPGELWSLAPRSRLPLQQPGFEDFAVENGQTYEYRVGVLYRLAGQEAESSPGHSLRLTPAPPGEPL